MTQHSPHHHDEQIELTPAKARQGKPGRPVLYVLLGGLALCLIAFVTLMGSDVDEGSGVVVQDTNQQ